MSRAFLARAFQPPTGHSNYVKTLNRAKWRSACITHE